MVTAVLIVLFAALICVAFKYYVSALVLSAWITENNYTPPTEEDTQRLARWVAQKMFEKKH